MSAQEPNEIPQAVLVRPTHLGADPRRSRIPRVTGILAIVFASLGLLGALALALGADDVMRGLDATRQGLGAFGTWMLVSLGLSAGLFGAHLMAGIQSVRYAASAPRWMTLYGVLAIALLVTDIIVSIATFPEGHGYRHRALYEEMVYPRLGMGILGMPWSILALVLLNLRSARLSCAAKRI